ncbi:MAG: nuclear transport factor 2 family protein [Fibrobacter sp.]|nr:nuclear transport factor 2 family protein [Fibrobacter sp.]
MRNTKDVFESHMLLVLNWNFDTDIEKNYSNDCVLVSSYGTFYGKEGIRRAFALSEVLIPEASFLYITKSWYGEVAFLEWQAHSDKTYVDDGADTFVIKNGRISIQTSHYTVLYRCS